MLLWQMDNFDQINFSWKKIWKFIMFIKVIVSQLLDNIICKLSLFTLEDI